MEARALTKVQETQPIIDLVLNGLTSEHSKRAYRRALLDFLAWHTVQGRPPLSKALVQQYKTKLQGDGLAPSTINQRLSAVRKLALEAADNGLIDPHLGNGIKAVKGVKSAGVRSGNWLTKAQAQRLLDAPDVETLKGLRDRAILAALIGSGLRRSEAAQLTFDKVTQREGRWVICDLKGKGNRTRTVPIPAWAKAAIDAWAEEAGIGNTGRVFRSVHKGGTVSGDRMSAQAVADVVKKYAEECGFDGLAAHDLRRTFAKLAHKGGAKLDQIQLSLGHASIKTTERYLGVEQDLQDAPCDRLGLRLGRTRTQINADILGLRGDAAAAGDRGYRHHLAICAKRETE
jgi:site-specific recombinase XerD